MYSKLSRKYNKKKYNFIFPDMKELNEKLEVEKEKNIKYADTCEKDAYGFLFSTIFFGVIFPIFYILFTNIFKCSIHIIVFGITTSIIALIIGDCYFYFKKPIFSNWNIIQVSMFNDLYNALCLNIPISDINITDKQVDITIGHRIYTYDIDAIYISDSNDIDIYFELDEKKNEMLCGVSHGTNYFNR